eukprot:c13657_g1_i1 orf=211-1656(+)
MAQKQQPSSSISPLLGASLVLNLSVLVFWTSRVYYHVGSAGTDLSISSKGTWTRVASVEAELAASFNCSGHGSVYVEMLFSRAHDGVACECDECFTGLHCQHVIPDCPAIVHSGDPLIFLPYWRQNDEASAVLIPGSYRIGYELSRTLIPGLEKEIRAMHKMVGNAVTEGRYIVVGQGETQLMMAMYTVVSMESQGLPVNVVVTPPYYDAYERQVKTVKPGSLTWGRPSLDEESHANWVPLEIVVSPNNPDGSIRTGVFKDPKTRTVYDLAYYWPHYTPITGPLDTDIMFFTLSKLTGHAGSRIGWAIVKDFAVYEKMVTALMLNSVSASHEAQLRAAQLLRTVREGYAKSKNLELQSLPTEYAAQQLLFHYVHTKLQSRWERMSRLFRGSDRFLIEQDLEPKYCNFFNKTVPRGPAFAWIRCQREEDESCVSIFKEAGIVGRGGERCGVTDRYVRLSMLSTDYAFENLLTHVQALLSKQL